MENRTVTVPRGYEILERRRKLPIREAEKILQTRKQDRYTRAERCGDEATLIRHEIRCPHCRKTQPAYDRYLSFASPQPNRISRERVGTWANEQYSFFEAHHLLPLNPVAEPKGPYECPHCGGTSQKGQPLQVHLRCYRKKVILSCSTCSMDALFQPFPRRFPAGISLPLTEEAVFNLRRGTTYIRLRNSRGELLAVTGVTKPENWEKSTLFPLLLENTLVKRLVMQGFREFWGRELPFSTAELTPELLVNLCAYGGYPRSFYQRLPLAQGEYRTDRSFRSLSRKLHTVTGLYKLLDESRLPRCKSIRKLIFRNPDYIFYIRQLETVYGWFGNVDYFLKFFDRSFTYPILSFLHQYRQGKPDIFFRDYAAAMGPRALLKKLEESQRDLQMFALQYGAMDENSRKRERERWNQRGRLRRPGMAFSVPMPSSRIPDSAVCGLRFVLLRTLREYEEAARTLDNCLMEYEPGGNPVFAVRDHQKTVAAIEVRDDTVLQAYAVRNRPLWEFPRINEAFHRWSKTFRLDLALMDEWDFDEEEELPF